MNNKTKKQYVEPKLEIIDIEMENVMSCSRDHLGNSGHHPDHEDCHQGHTQQYRTQFGNYD